MTSSFVGLVESIWSILICRQRGLIRWETDTHDLGEMFGMMNAFRVPLLPSRTYDGREEGDARALWS